MQSAQCRRRRAPRVQARAPWHETIEGGFGPGRFSHDDPGVFPDFPAILCNYTAAYAPINATAWNHTELLVPVGTENMRQLYIKTARSFPGVSRILCGMISDIDG